MYSLLFSFLPFYLYVRLFYFLSCIISFFMHLFACLAACLLLFTPTSFLLYLHFPLFPPLPHYTLSAFFSPPSLLPFPLNTLLRTVTSHNITYITLCRTAPTHRLKGHAFEIFATMTMNGEYNSNNDSYEGIGQRSVLLSCLILSCLALPFHLYSPPVFCLLHSYLHCISILSSFHRSFLLLFTCFLSLLYSLLLTSCFLFSSTKLSDTKRDTFRIEAY